MPRSRWVLFTVRRYVDPVRNLEEWPGAAAALAAAVRRKYKGTLARNGLGERENAERILGYLDGIAVDAGIAPGLAGVVPEPWERAATEDGTWAAEADREEMSGGDGIEVARNVEGLNAFKKDAVPDELRGEPGAEG